MMYAVIAEDVTKDESLRPLLAELTEIGFDVMVAGSEALNGFPVERFHHCEPLAGRDSASLAELLKSHRLGVMQTILLTGDETLSNQYQQIPYAYALPAGNSAELLASIELIKKGPY